MKTHIVEIDCNELIVEKGRVAATINRKIQGFRNRISLYDPAVKALEEVLQELYGGTVFELFVDTGTVKGVTDKKA